MNEIYIDVEPNCAEPDWLEGVSPFVQAVLKKLKKSNWELSILFCADPFIADLNAQYRQIEGPTDVLSFEQGDEVADDEGKIWFSAGDIVISIDSLKSNAQEFSVSMDEELKRLLIHGILHLDGMDHSDNSPEQEMLRFQEDLLKEFSSIQIIKDCDK